MSQHSCASASANASWNELLGNVDEESSDVVQTFTYFKNLFNISVKTLTSYNLSTRSILA
ncbi:hypothetical protein SDC9_133334 [bioreactor metagenome]|uniref:Uncharacterized protein n=1 Tax=bioreactor metagenome TaxID=1076179 RepID=A0A645DAI6_9ZZZZ